MQQLIVHVDIPSYLLGNYATDAIETIAGYILRIRHGRELKTLSFPYTLCNEGLR